MIFNGSYFKCQKSAPIRILQENDAVEPMSNSRANLRITAANQHLSIVSHLLFFCSSFSHSLHFAGCVSVNIEEDMWTIQERERERDRVLQ